jgi:hypothetical protein
MAINYCHACIESFNIQNSEYIVHVNLRIHSHKIQIMINRTVLRVIAHVSPALSMDNKSVKANKASNVNRSKFVNYSSRKDSSI